MNQSQGKRFLKNPPPKSDHGGSFGNSFKQFNNGQNSSKGLVVGKQKLIEKQSLPIAHENVSIPQLSSVAASNHEGFRNMCFKDERSNAFMKRGVWLRRDRLISIQIYLSAINNLIGKHCIEMFRLTTGNKLEIFLDSEKSAIDLAVNGLSVNDEEVKVFLLLRKPQQLFISGIVPWIEDHEIIELMTEFGEADSSRLKKLYFDLDDPENNRVDFGTRVINLYRKPDTNLPHTVELHAYGDVHILSITPHYVKCNYCGNLGHVVRNCLEPRERLASEVLQQSISNDPVKNVARISTLRPPTYNAWGVRTEQSAPSKSVVESHLDGRATSQATDGDGKVHSLLPHGHVDRHLSVSGMQSGKAGDHINAVEFNCESYDKMNSVSLDGVGVDRDLLSVCDVVSNSLSVVHTEDLSVPITDLNCISKANDCDSELNDVVSDVERLVEPGAAQATIGVDSSVVLQDGDEHLVKDDLDSTSCVKDSVQPSPDDKQPKFVILDRFVELEKSIQQNKESEQEVSVSVTEEGVENGLNEGVKDLKKTRKRKKRKMDSSCSTTMAQTGVEKLFDSDDSRESDTDITDNHVSQDQGHHDESHMCIDNTVSIECGLQVGDELIQVSNDVPDNDVCQSEERMLVCDNLPSLPVIENVDAIVDNAHTEILAIADFEDENTCQKGSDKTVLIESLDKLFGILLLASTNKRNRRKIYPDSMLKDLNLEQLFELVSKFGEIIDIKGKMGETKDLIDALKQFDGAIIGKKLSSKTLTAQKRAHLVSKVANLGLSQFMGLGTKETFFRSDSGNQKGCRQPRSWVRSPERIEIPIDRELVRLLAVAEEATISLIEVDTYDPVFFVDLDPELMSKLLFRHYSYLRKIYKLRLLRDFVNALRIHYGLDPLSGSLVVRIEKFIMEDLEMISHVPQKRRQSFSRRTGVQVTKVEGDRARKNSL